MKEYGIRFSEVDSGHEGNLIVICGSLTNAAETLGTYKTLPWVVDPKIVVRDGYGWRDF